MQIKIKGIILFIKPLKENDLYLKLLSENDELISGIVYGGMSKSKKGIYQLGSNLSLNILTKSNRPSSMSGELTEPFLSPIMHNKYKLNCLISTISIINLSIIEGQQINNLYVLVREFLKFMIFNEKWFNEYCIFLFRLLKIIGYEIDYSSNIKNKYFNLNHLDFRNIESEETIIFPHELLKNDNKIKIQYTSVESMFRIFETIFVRNHLANFNLHLPNQYHLFKKLILNYLKN